MKKLILFVLICLSTYKYVEAQTSPGMLLNKQYVDLKGRAGNVIFINSTPDQIKLGYLFFNWFPYQEFRDTITIAPGKTDSISLTYNFPDFVDVNNSFEVYNAPGGRVTCEIKGLDKQKQNLVFSGSFANENNYYQAYHKFLGHYSQETRAYYAASDRLTDWNLFPAKADSITKTRLKFLDDYKDDLPDWFKPHERRRLLYNQYFLLSNALVSKEFYGGKPISVDKSYYDFEKQVNRDTDMVLNSTYLYCINDYFGHKARLLKLEGMSGPIYAIDKLYHRTDIGDVSLMLDLGKLYRANKLSYDSLITTLQFKQPERKLAFDSLVQIKLGAPRIGKRAPAMKLTDINGKVVSLNDYLGNTIIVNFWAVWCGPCKAEFPDENKLYNEYKNKKLVVINVCFDSDKEAWLRDSKKYNLQMINLYSQKSDYNELLRRYNLSAPPRSVLIDKNGIVVNNYLPRASMLRKEELDKI
ncbi:TlpA disulfide reductase family protein [Mucilaginibacter sp. CAU 1740]|uniref:TlpA family protein disulfide reductase n=1 Tax=Mucilaginibacter sp. CAU 1740 TaxID=3140365 RepID=UPI00325A55E3